MKREDDGVITDANAFVVDVGALNTYWGYSGSDGPLQSQSSTWCDFPAETEATRQRSRYPAFFLSHRDSYRPQPMIIYNELSSPLKEYTGLCPSDGGTFSSKLNKELLIHTMDYINNFFPGETMKDRPLIVTQNSKSKTACSTALAEVAFESAGVGAMFCGRKASMTALALGRPTAMVVETGPILTSVTPVFEGYTLSRHSELHEMGGASLECVAAEQLKLWDAQNRVFDPSFYPFKVGPNQAAPSTDAEMAEPKSVDPAYLHFARRAVLQDIVESCVYVPLSEAEYQQSGDENMSDGTDSDDVSYELPDGKLLFLPKTTCARIGEMWIKPGASLCPTTSWPGLAGAICRCGFQCDVELVSSLLSNIVVAGGPSCMGGMMERLSAELDGLTEINLERGDGAPPSTKNLGSVKLKSAALPKDCRKFTSWIGASILGSLASFERLLVTRSDWSEYGEAIIAKRFVL